MSAAPPGVPWTTTRHMSLLVGPRPAPLSWGAGFAFSCDVFEFSLPTRLDRDGAPPYRAVPFCAGWTVLCFSLAVSPSEPGACQPPARAISRARMGGFQVRCTVEALVARAGRAVRDGPERAGKPAPGRQTKSGPIRRVTRCESGRSLCLGCLVRGDVEGCCPVVCDTGGAHMASPWADRALSPARPVEHLCFPLLSEDTRRSARPPHVLVDPPHENGPLGLDQARYR